MYHPQNLSGHKMLWVALLLAVIPTVLLNHYKLVEDNVMQLYFLSSIIIWLILIVIKSIFIKVFQ